MRLAPEDHAVIRDEVSRIDSAAEVFLFGSRTDDTAKGGDIDLLVVSDKMAFADQLRLRMAILDRIGWQQLDLMVRRRDGLDEPMAARAMDTAIRL